PSGTTSARRGCDQSREDFSAACGCEAEEPFRSLDTMRVSFSCTSTARAAVTVLEAYGYSAKQIDRDVITDCPTLLAVPAIQKRLGLAQVERLDLRGGCRPWEWGELSVGLG